MLFVSVNQYLEKWICSSTNYAIYIIVMNIKLCAIAIIWMMNSYAMVYSMPFYICLLLLLYMYLYIWIIKATSLSFWSSAMYLKLMFFIFYSLSEFVYIIRLAWFSTKLAFYELILPCIHFNIYLIILYICKLVQTSQVDSDFECVCSQTIILSLVISQNCSITINC